MKSLSDESKWKDAADEYLPNPYRSIVIWTWDDCAWPWLVIDHDLKPTAA